MSSLLTRQRALRLQSLADRVKREKFAVASPATTAQPREELALVIAQGENATKNLIWDKVLGAMPINYETAHLVKLMLQDTLGLRHIAGEEWRNAPGTEFNRMSATFGDATLTVKPRGAEIVIPRRVVLKYKSIFDVTSFFVSRFGKEISGLTKEVLVANAVFNTTNFGSATNSAVAYTNANLTTISYLADSVAATRRLKAKGESGPYIQVMNGVLFERIRFATQVVAYASGALQPGRLADKDTILSGLKAFGIMDIVIADSYSNTAAEGAAAILQQNWSSNYIATIVPGNVQLPDPVEDTEQMDGIGVPTLSGIGALVYWEGYDDAGQASEAVDARQFPGGSFVETYWETKIDSLVIRIQMSHNPQITNPNAGDLINPQYS